MELSNENHRLSFAWGEAQFFPISESVSVNEVGI